jgi:hypothetical protein
LAIHHRRILAGFSSPDVQVVNVFTRKEPCIGVSINEGELNVVLRIGDEVHANGQVDLIGATSRQLHRSASVQREAKGGRRAPSCDVLLICYNGFSLDVARDV